MTSQSSDTPPAVQRRLFMSYAQADSEAIRFLREGIETLHYQVWMDRKLEGGQAWWDEILAQIRSCDAMVVPVSPSLLRSEAATRERRYALQLGKPLVPILIAPVRMDVLPPEIAALHVIDFTNSGPATGFQLAAALSSLPARRPLPGRLPLPPSVPISYLSNLAETIRAPSLSLDEQLSVVARLASSLAQPDEREAALELLGGLENRRDLYHATAKEIDRLLHMRPQRSNKPAPPYKSPSNKPPPSPKPPRGHRLFRVILVILIGGILLFVVNVVVSQNNTTDNYSPYHCYYYNYNC